MQWMTAQEELTASVDFHLSPEEEEVEQAGRNIRHFLARLDTPLLFERDDRAFQGIKEVEARSECLLEEKAYVRGIRLRIKLIEELVHALETWEEEEEILLDLLQDSRQALAARAAVYSPSMEEEERSQLFKEVKELGEGLLHPLSLDGQLDLIRAMIPLSYGSIQRYEEVKQQLKEASASAVIENGGRSV
ncbi:hypothetical protein ALCH109712_05525 [Alkalicoccus chagannorensis]